MKVEDTPRRAPEKEMLQAFLQQNRAIMVWKSEGMTDAEARQAPFASDTSMTGMLRHLAVVERWWFREFFAGEKVDHGFDFDTDPDSEWHFDGTETLAAAIEDYKAAVDESNAIIDRAEPDDLSALDRKGEHFSMRWILIHMIEETARHAGHADILREHLDETLGYLPGR